MTTTKPSDQPSGQQQQQQPPPSKAVADMLALVASSGSHVVKLTLEVNYSLEKLVAAPTSISYQRKKPGNPPDAAAAKKRKSALDDYRKFYLAYSIGGVYEGKTEVLLADQSPWVWTHDVAVKSTFLADLYDKPTTVSLFEIVTRTIDGSIVPRPDDTGELAASIALNPITSTGAVAGARAGSGRTLNGSRLRLSASVTTTERVGSLSALAKRQIILANAHLPARDRHALVQKAARYGFGIDEVVQAAAAEDRAAGQRRSGSAQKRGQTKSGLSSRPRSGEKKEGGEATIPADAKKADTDTGRASTRATTASSSNNNTRTRSVSRGGSPRRRTVFENPDGTPIREGPLPHHFDRPDRHLSASAKSRSKRASPEPSQPSAPGTAGADDGAEWKEFLSVMDSIRKDTGKEKEKEKVGAKKAPLPRKHPKPPPVIESKVPIETAGSRRPSTTKSDGRGKGRTTVEIKDELRGVISLDLSDFFWGDLSVNAELPRTDGMNFFRVKLFLNTPLLSKQQEESLNPISITMLAANDMPDRPVPFSELNRLCEPVFTRFSFPTDPHTHQSLAAAPHGRRIAFNTRHLVLGGLLDEDRLKEELLGRRLEVEVHDREVKGMREGAGSMSGNAPPPTSGPFGVASFALTDLTRGATTLTLTAPILPGRYRKGRSGVKQLPAASWVESAATLAVKVEARYPLLASQNAGKGGGLFRRGVVVTSITDDHTPALVQQHVERANIHALRIRADDDEDTDNTDATLRSALGMHQLTREEIADPDLDVILGYHIYDDQYRILMLEGLPEGRLADLFAAISAQPTPPLHTYFSPSATFNRRLWTSSASILHTQLRFSLKSITSKTGTFLRRRTGERCFGALNALLKMIDPRTNDATAQLEIETFPTSDMILALNGMCAEAVTADEALSDEALRAAGGDGGAGVGWGAGIEWGGTAAAVDVDKGAHEEGEPALKRPYSPDTPLFSAPPKQHFTQPTHPTSKARPTLRGSGGAKRVTFSRGTLPSAKRVDDLNVDFAASLAERGFRKVNFVAYNFRQYEGIAAEPRKRTRQIYVHNYSINRFSSTAEHLEELRFQMAQNPTTVYSYGGTYLSQLIPRVDYDEEVEEERLGSKARRLPPGEFIVSTFAVPDKRRRGMGATNAAVVPV
ncbi:uncharacterized protein EV422DRAFT_566376 [Fimicolochytrium jonesii]|uniref:uncharacterized protein n=1 Tax=Fimicolochytrium jonesii TaxID=1396493 RepID=UPI0022FE0918|nr:uncharacterized protein EV422DRAFT_566376 [Fimicolochytrium jonesii]KAI8822710.1 hypothetical protein EV422DRAFT_566376 [Fimicolochytrium jonesii]